MQPESIISGRYRVLRRLGSGGMGSVYAAYDEHLEREVALKLLHPDVAADRNARDRFLREAQIAAQLVHPNIVRIYDVGASAEGVFLVQELLDGQTLDQVIPLAPQRAIGVAIAVAEALDLIHRHGYVHCDVKPENIMLVPELDGERVVLLDFGIARAQDAHTTTLLATPHYIAPERALGARATPASDLYALGVVLYVMLTGRLPFDGPHVHAIIHAHVHAAFPPLDIDAPGAPLLAAIVRKLTAKQPGARYRSAAALRTELRAAWEDTLQTRLLPTQLFRPRVKRVGTPAPRPQRRVWALPLLPLLAICLVLAFMWSGGYNPDIAVQTEAFRPARAVEMAHTMTVPDVIGLPLEDALSTLDGAGLVGVVGAAIPSDQRGGTVAATVPGFGEVVGSGIQVLVQTSAGRTPAVPVPSATVSGAMAPEPIAPTSSPTAALIVPTPSPAIAIIVPTLVVPTPTQADPTHIPPTPTVPPTPTLPAPTASPTPSDDEAEDDVADEEDEPEERTPSDDDEDKQKGKDDKVEPDRRDKRSKRSN